MKLRKKFQYNLMKKFIVNSLIDNSTKILLKKAIRAQNRGKKISLYNN